jgi:hypothetical protein
LPVRHGDPAGAAQVDIGAVVGLHTEELVVVTHPQIVFIGVFHKSGRMNRPMKQDVPWTSLAGHCVS